MKIKTFILTIAIVIIYTTAGSAQNLLRELSNWDPDLESGFPVIAYYSGGTYQAGPMINTLVGNFDNDSQLEFALTALARGPLYIWKADSSLLPGWPTNDIFGAAYSAAGNITGTAQKLEIVTTYWGSDGIFAYSSDGSLLPGWPRHIFGYGYTSPALADINDDGYDEIFVPWGYHLLGLKADGTDLPGWPVQFGSDLHTPAIGDIENDGGLEIVTASGASSVIQVYAFHTDGNLVAGFPITIQGRVNTFPVIGDIDSDQDLEIIVVGETTVYIISGDGTIEKALKLNGRIDYGPAPTLADLDGDAYPEIIVATNSAINIWKGDGTTFPGWPLTGLHLYESDSIPLVGDIDGDQELEIVMSGVDGTYVFGLDGKLDPRFPKISGGLAGAIADIDLDGHNEIIVSDGLGVPYVQFPNWIRVFDLGGSQRGRIEWGQFGGGPEHRGLYPVPNPPSPPQPPPNGNLTFLPIVNRPIYSLPQRLYGKVMINGIGVKDAPLELRFFNGTTWSTITNLKTAQDGSYTLSGVPRLNEGEAYSFRSINAKYLPGRLYSWSTRPIYVYSDQGNVGISQFDIADLPLKSPQNGVTLPLPVTFEWITRTVTLSDWYAFVLYDPTDGDPSLIAYPYQNTNGVIMDSLPTGFNYNTQYAWTIWIISPEEAVGVPLETRYITFLKPSQSNGNLNNSGLKSSPIDWNNYPDLPCHIYNFLQKCDKE